MIKWEKIGKSISIDKTVIVYSCCMTSYTVESRKRRIPHASKPGAWEYTSYFVLKDGEEVIEKHSLKDAKKYVEDLLKGGD